MSAVWWVAAYLVIATFLAWIAFGRGLKTRLGGVLATLFVEGVEPMRDRGIRQAAAVLLLLGTIWFIIGLMNPAFRF